jgi:hypothetical protein
VGVFEDKNAREPVDPFGAKLHHHELFVSEIDTLKPSRI